MPTMTLPSTVPSMISVASDYVSLCELVADRIAALVRSKPQAVLGLATGSTPLGVYDLLAKKHQDEGLDFSGVTCFNLDEYYPISPESPHSYHHFMQEKLFSKINCTRWYLPNGRLCTETEIEQHCQRFEAKIRVAGGIDLQLLGIGRTGHIGFNEPGSSPESRTRLVTLHSVTRQDAATSFGGLWKVPHQAVSMGIGTILEAREIVMMATSSAKVEIVRVAFTEEMTERIPASWVRMHPNVRLYLDENAASLLAKNPF